MPRLELALTTASILLCAPIAGCTVTLPGEPVGTFEITMRLEENTCGPQAVVITDGQRFVAELRRGDNNTAYWRIPDQKMLDGWVDDEKYHFTFTSIVATSAPERGPRCDIVQSASLVAEVEREESDDDDKERDAGTDGGEGDAGASEALVLTAVYKLDIGQAAGTDCSAALAPKGPFVNLPCVVRYRFRGVERAPFD
jgi:hypothetical protein